MSIKEPGVIKRDGIYFWSANPYAKEHLFYLLWGGMYWLDVPYRVKRRYMDALYDPIHCQGDTALRTAARTFCCQGK
jgi:hypothetical protein